MARKTIPMRFSGLFALPLVLGLAQLPGCPGDGPQPTPTPIPWECELGFPYCDDTEPPQQCSTEESPCVHNPTDNPQHCEVAPDCDPGGEFPEPQCPQFMDRGGTIRTTSEACDCYFGQAWKPCEDPPAGECIFPQGVHPADFTKGATTHVLGDQVNDAMTRITGCLPGSRCVTGMEADEFFAAVTAELRATGLCAGRHNDTPPAASDEIAVGTSCTGWWEGYHVYNYGGSTVVWSPGAARPSWKIDPRYCEASPGPTPTPEPTPPGPGECEVPAGCGEKIKLKKHNGYWDSTYNVTSCADHCASIGYCCMPASPSQVCGDPGCITRANCPIMPEGDPARPACEADILDQKWWCNGDPIQHRGNNPAQANCLGHVKTCSSDGRVCNEADW